MKKLLKVLLVLMTVVSIAGCSSKTTTEKATKKTKTLSGNYQVEIKVDGLIFHRVIDGFMIQGGDPKGDGTGGSKETIKGEFSDNGVKNPLSHTRGALSMARSQDNDSASSQFFIVQSDSTYLDGQYAVFGYVYEGMDIVDQICKDVKVEDNNGTVKKENQPVIESIRCKKI